MLFVNVLATVLFSNIVFERFYINAKHNELKEYAEEINQYFIDIDISVPNFRDNLINTFDKMERNNIEIIWFAYDEVAKQVDIGYATKITGRYLPSDPPDTKEVQEYIATLINLGELSSLANVYEYKTSDVNVGIPSINLITYVYEDTDVQSGNVLRSYLIFSSPKEYIETTADTAVRFVLYISLVTLLIAIIAVIIISEKITKPIVNINKVANKISNLDFSENCKVTGKDEISDLGKSINEMSTKLQDSIDYLKQRAQLLKNDLEKQETSNKTKKEFIASVSHDFKTPLSLIMAYSELLMDKHKDDEETRGQLLIITDQAIKMNLMVNQLLTLSQLESGAAKIEDTIFCLNEAVESVIKDLHIMIEQRNINLTFKYQDDYIVKGDYNKITHVITNLLENAIKYCDEKKIINININEIDGKIRTSIYNTHPGISQQALPNLFNSFYKEDKSRGGNSNSYGLGLSIVKVIMEMHNCSYGAYNSNAGVVFWFELAKHTD
ncbi:MAG TPA: HAMP domain-containing sensor histidine kinase [Clostridia bacterium]|nr:MAG: Sensor histidine kinase CssS [Firmicutes bacterium ADurb.Bin146]HQM39526.1 HAMP domain-containing sensor histidine kinase [Clostridia bacterium]